MVRKAATHARGIACFIFAGLLAPAAACAQAPQAFRVRGSAELQEGVARIRAATARFASLDSAVAAGYQRDVADCIANGRQGAMGYHHVNEGSVAAHLDLEKPQILVYERAPDGRYLLDAVEYFIPFRLWPADSVPPVLLGQRLQPYNDLRIWDTHVWVWKENPSGLFAGWNPNVRCLAAPAAHPMDE
jgi:ABC-type amino acid transport substrate-binding protein